MRAVLRAAATCVALACIAAAPGEDPAAAFREGTTAARLDRAAALRARDVRGLVTVLTALGNPDGTPDDDREFLLACAGAETGRVLRAVVAESLQKLDNAAAAGHLLAGVAREKDVARAARRVECAGLVAGAADAPRFVPLLAHGSDLVALTAADALARCGTPAEVPALVEAALSRKWPLFTDHCAWAAMDVLASRAKAQAAFQAAAAAPDLAPERAARAKAALAVLSDPKLAPQRWTAPFAALRKVLAAAPGNPRIGALNPAMEGWLRRTTAWLQTTCPAEHWVVCAAVNTVDTGGGPRGTILDVDGAKIGLGDDDAGLPPEKVAYLVHRFAAVLLRRKLGEPWQGRRGWDQAILDSYDLCAAGKIHDAGTAKGSVSREKFVESAVELRPWEERR